LCLWRSERDRKAGGDGWACNGRCVSVPIGLAVPWKREPVTATDPLLHRAKAPGHLGDVLRGDRSSGTLGFRYKDVLTRFDAGLQFGDLILQCLNLDRTRFRHG